MKFIPPLEIASKIMTLITEADKELILVSPYVKINDWEKMKKCLAKAVNKGVKISFIARQNTNDDLSPLKALDIYPILIRDLHAKVYINDKYGIVTSQNITQYSDINSIDIGYQTEDEKERTELIDFVNNYIKDIKTEDEKVKPIDEDRRPLALEKNTFLRIENQNNDNVKQLSEYNLEKLHQAFINNFSKSKIKKTSSYLFCDDILPFADVMIHTRYIIKINKYRTDCDLILKKIEEINFSYNHKFKIELLTSHKSFYYLDFIPIGSLKMNKLIDDYFNITKSILKSDVIKVLKVQKKEGAW
ncbi:hypothetical protein [Flavobacterium sp. ZS1P14]|uniref:hypothetical protein n=1 Tax=Flavobacterium sp. ZS1P14 TaxID=3401729 RepID=UPI003AADC8DB